MSISESGRYVAGVDPLISSSPPLETRLLVISMTVGNDISTLG